MKKIVIVLLLLWSVPAAASDISFDRTYTQQNFHDFSQEIGSTLIYRSIGPAVSLGITGFDLGAEAVFSDINENKDYWKKAVSGQNPPSILSNARISFIKGLPMDFDAGVVLGTIVDPGVPYFGAEVRYAILKDRALVPGVSVRGTYSRTFNVDQLELSTYNLDLSISKGFGVGIKIVPYGGVGMAWVSSKADNLTAGLSLNKEEFSRAYGFVGARLVLGFFSITGEVDYGAIPSYNLQIGFGF